MPSAKQSLQSSAAGFSPAVGQAIKLGAAAPTGQARKAKEARIARASCDVITSNLVAPKEEIEALTSIIKAMADMGIALSSPKVSLSDDGRYIVSVNVEVIEGHKASARSRVIKSKILKVRTHRLLQISKYWKTSGPTDLAFLSRYRRSYLQPRPAPDITILKAAGLEQMPESEPVKRALSAFSASLKSRAKQKLGTVALLYLKSLKGQSSKPHDSAAIAFATDTASIAKVKLFSPAASLNKKEIDALSKLAEIRFDLVNYIATLAVGFLKDLQNRGDKYIKIDGIAFRIDDLTLRVEAAGKGAAYADLVIKVIVAYKNNDHKQVANVILTFLANLWVASKLSKGNPIPTAILTVSFSFGLDSAGGIIGIVEFAEEKSNEAFNYLLSKRDSEGKNMFDVMADPFRAFGINR